MEEFKRQFFGGSSEKTSARKNKEASSPEETKKVTVKAHTRERKPKATRNDLYADLPVREIICPVPETERFCDWCNAEMIPLKPTFVREEQTDPP